MSSRHDVILLPPPIGGKTRMVHVATATTAASTSLWNPSRVITSSTDATPIVVTLAAGHGYLVGDSVTIAGHTTNVAANGTFVLSAVSATTVTLTGSVGSGAGAGASGTMVFSDNNYATPECKVWVAFEALTNDCYIRIGAAATAATTQYNGVLIKAGATPGIGVQCMNKFYLTPSLHTNVDWLSTTGAGLLKWWVCSPPGERERI